MSANVVSIKQQMRSAQAFQFFSIISIIIPPIIPIWIAASIFVYAAVAHHPNLKVREYLVPAGYRFYGILGAWVVVLNFSSHLATMVGGGLKLAIILWVVSFLVVVPLNVRDILRAQKEPWQELTIEQE